MHQAFAADLERLFESLQAIDTELIVQARVRAAAAECVCVCTHGRSPTAHSPSHPPSHPPNTPVHPPSRPPTPPAPPHPQAGAGTVSASVAADDAAVNRFLLELIRVGEAHGVRFPREFALLVKQASEREGRSVCLCVCLPLCVGVCGWGGEGEAHGVPPPPTHPPRPPASAPPQILYFDRYQRILAPQLRVLQDARVRMGGEGGGGSGMGGGGMGGGGGAPPGWA